MSQIANTPKPPYYSVIFTYQRTSVDDGYDVMEKRTAEVVSKMKGFLGAESTRDENGFGVLISYWDSEESINAWRANLTHRDAKESGRNQWYSKYISRICKVEYEYSSKITMDEPL